MTRFLYLSDSHWGAGAEGYHLQPKCDERLPDLLAALEGWMRQHEPVDFILHGGDMIHATTEEAIRVAAEHFSLSVPVHLCLGNHDLTRPESVDMWLRLAPQFFGGHHDYAIDGDDCLIHVIPNQYGATPFLWTDTQEPHFLATQLEALEDRLRARPDATHLISTHSPVFPLEPAQTGMADPFHQPPEPFTRLATHLADRYGVACVLGAHSHANMRRERDGVNYVTTSSFVETPFEFKLFEISDHSVSMETHNLLDRVDFSAAYDWDSTYVQGRACDRSFRRELH